MALNFKSKDKQLRLVFTTEKVNAFPESKMTAVIGPFDSFQDKKEFQEVLEILLRGYNLENY